MHSRVCFVLPIKHKCVYLPFSAEEEEEEFYKLLPANKENKGAFFLLQENISDHLCQLWQSRSDLHET